MNAARRSLATALAKARSSRRRTEGGAAMFIVAMTTTVLASVGVYALAASANEVRTSGNERQNTQTHYLAEYGVLGITHEIITSKAQFYLGLMLSSSDHNPANQYFCASLPGVPSTASPVAKACRRLGSAELGVPWTGTTVTVPYGGASAYQSGIAPGSFGPIPMSGDFFVELTEPTQAQAPPRYSTDLHFCFIEMTATANGITQPILPATVSDVKTGSYGNQGVEVQRARIIAGPVQCPR